jgi:hypothetical protein
MSLNPHDIPLALSPHERWCGGATVAFVEGGDGEGRGGREVVGGRCSVDVGLAEPAECLERQR